MIQLPPLTPELADRAAEAAWATFHDQLRLSNPGMPARQPWKAEKPYLRSMYVAMVLAAYAAIGALQAPENPGASA